MFRYFTLSEANAALPAVAKKFQTAITCKEAVTKIERRLQECAMNGASVKTYMELKQELNAAVTRLYYSIEALEGMGVSLKGLDEGLIDFPSKKFDEDVWLCWKSGETEIRFWHEINTGFMGRKPIAVSDDSLV